MLFSTGNKLLSIGRQLCEWHEPPAPPTPTYPTDMHFIYLANDYDGNKIPNLAANSTLGSFNRNSSGTLTKTGSGSSCYITNGNNRYNYLYVEMSTEDLNLMKATSNTYTYYFRFVYNSSNCGGILCWRSPSPSYGGGDSYVYMFRCEDSQIQFHTTSGYNTGLSLTTDTVYKGTVNDNNVNIVDLNDSSKSWTYSGGGFTRTMNRMMTTFWAGYRTEYAPNAQFYGAAGIARATTAEEDTAIKNLLMNQAI